MSVGIAPADLDEMEKWARATWPLEQLAGLRFLTLIAEVRRLRALLNLAVGGNRPHG